MKIIHQNGFSRDELLSYRNIIYKNVLDSAQDIVMAMRKIGVDCQLPENRVRISSFSSSLSHPSTRRMPKPSMNTASNKHPILSSQSPSQLPSNSCGRTPSSPPSWTTAANFTSWTVQHSTYLCVLLPIHLLTTRSFFEEVSRIGGLDYVPTETDVLRARAKSTGITETRFNMGQLSCVFLPLQSYCHHNLARQNTHV
jgi:guanine nucleotide-binding protein G(i) subunit alpha